MSAPVMRGRGQSMSENYVLVAALCMASPFCAAVGLLSGLFWRIHVLLGCIATLATVWFLAIGLTPIIIFPTIAAAIVWTFIGLGVAVLFLRRRNYALEIPMAGRHTPKSV
jgi:hypothetical protein